MTINLSQISDQEKEWIDSLIESDENESNNVIVLLQKIQDQFDYLPSNVIFYLAEKLKIPPAEVYGIATFYSQFKMHPKGKYTITCCEGTACHVKGGASILTYIEQLLKIKSGETTKDNLFSLETVACLGTCAISPVCIINGKVYGNLTLKKIQKILRNLKKGK